MIDAAMIGTIYLTGSRPRLHPNGFIQLDLGNDRRLHVWPDEPLQAQKTRHPIHTHVFDMESTIMCGELINAVYFLMEDPDGDHSMYEAQPVGGNDTVLADTGRRGDLMTDYVQTLKQGDTYKLPAFRMHDSQPNGFTATIMTKKPIYGCSRPMVAVPFGLKPDNDFRRETIDEQILWKHLNRAFEIMRQPQGA